MTKQMITIRLNGVKRTFCADAELTLLSLLRDKAISANAGRAP